MKIFRNQKGIALIQAVIAMGVVGGFLAVENLRQSKQRKINLNKRNATTIQNDL